MSDVEKKRWNWRCHLDISTGKVFYEVINRYYTNSYTRSYEGIPDVGDTQWERPDEGSIEPHWIAHLDVKSGKLYFEDLDTRMIEWEKPLEFYDINHTWSARLDTNNAMNGKYYYENLATHKTQWEVPKCFQTKLQKEWKRHFDTTTNKYFYENLNTDNTAWSVPNNVIFDDNGFQVIAKLRRPPLFLDEEDYMIMIDLVHGFIKKSLLNLDIYPNDLTNIFIQFIGDIFVRFNVYPNEYKRLIKNIGKFIDKHIEQCAFSIACSNGWNSGIHQIKIKCKAFGAPPIIGITTNYNQYTQDGFWCNETNGLIYGYYSPCIINQNHSLNEELPDLTAGDVVTLTVNCDQWNLTVSVKNKSETVEIEANHTYYFCMGIQAHYCQYELLR